MRNLIEVTQNAFLTCDNESCNYEIPFKKHYVLDGFVGHECPKCGDVMLKEKDLKNYKKVMKVVNFINKYFSWITFFYGKIEEEDYVSIEMKCKDGVHFKEKK